MPAPRATVADFPLPSLLSQVLVAFTVEFDNEFERRMGGAGYTGARLSLVVWSNLMRFLAARRVSVRDLAGQALAPQERLKHELGCLERWGFVTLGVETADDQPISQREHDGASGDVRDGWGSGRGIRADWSVRLTAKGLKAVETWLPLCDEIERRWRERFGKDAIGGLHKALRAVVDQFEVELPQALPGSLLVPEEHAYPPRVTRSTDHLALATLLSQALLAFTIEFERESRVSLALCSNALRVLGPEPVRAADIPRLTGASPETSGVGWQLKPLVVVERDPTAARGKVVRLTPLGLAAQQRYHVLVDAIERQWEDNFGKRAVGDLRKSLQGLLNQRDGDRSLLSVGLVPPAGVVRAGDRAPALGRRDVGPAAKQRMRHLVAQTEAFVRDPLGTLPHYPLWDMNRGFGP